jgi:hypothetical protein
MRTLRLSALAISIVGLTSCSGSREVQQNAAAPEVRIQQIPPADLQKYGGMRELKNWQNPYLIIKPNGVALLDVANHEEHLLKPEKLAETLAALPASAWPYGRIVVVSDPSASSSANELAPIRRNRGIVAGTLESMHILINWVPSA